MRGIVKGLRRRGRAGKPTEGAASGFPDVVGRRLRCPGIAARRPPSLKTGCRVSVNQIAGDML